MHILLIHQAFATLDEPGGTRHYELAMHLAHAGYQISIIASPVSYLTGKKENHPKFESKAEGFIRIYRVYTYHALHKNFVHRFLSFFSFMVSSFFMSLTIKNVDIIWGTSPPIFQAFSAWLISFLKRKPFLLEVRDLWPAFAIEVGVLKNHILICLSLWLEKFLYHQADQIVINSPGYRDHIQKKGGKNIHLIPNGSDLSLFPLKVNHDVRAHYGWNNSYIVLYAGAHGVSNDIGVILQAAEHLKNDPEIILVLVGDGKEKPALKQSAQAMQLNNLTFMDPVPKNEMSEILSAADACIAILKPIDLYKTTYPNKVFDYMAAAKPVILAIDGVIRKVVESANCGIFCQPGDPVEMANAIRFLKSNPEKSQQMGNNGRNYLKKHFNRVEIADQLLDVLEKMVNQDERKNSDR